MHLTPGSAVSVFNHHLHANSAFLDAHQSLSYCRKGQLLYNTQALLVCAIDGVDQLGFQVVSPAPLAIDRAAIANTIAVIEVHLDTGWQR